MAEHKHVARWELLGLQLRANRFVVPVVGVQGAGKSTFLNALLFERPVLPVDADETTCVPVEIAAGMADQATVRFQDGREEVIDGSEASLTRFVHQASNPGNEKGVESIRLYSRSPLLTGGVVMVDLPGLGSLTTANRDTTLEYLRTATALLYVLRTVPPLTRAEAADLGAVWPSLPSVFFLQNQWVDEAPTEVADGVSTNRRAIRKLGEQIGRSFQPGEPRIDVVNAYEALKAALTNDSTLTSASGLRDFRSHLGEELRSWPSRRDGGVREQVRGDLRRAQMAWSARLADLDGDVADALARLESERRRRDARLDGLRQLAQSHRDRLSEFEGEVRRLAREWKNKQQPRIRNQMRTLMRAGVVDGSKLDHSLAQEVREASADLRQRATVLLVAVSTSLEGQLGALEDWTVADPEVVLPGLNEATRPEQLLDKAAGAGGAIGGGVAGAAAVKIVAGGMAGGPPGALVAAGMVVGSVLLAWLGSKAGGAGRDAITRQRAKRNEPQVLAAVGRNLREIETAVSSGARNYHDGVLDLLRTWERDQRARLDAEFDARRRNASADEEARSARREQVGSALRRVTRALQRMEGE